MDRRRFLAALSFVPGLRGASTPVKITRITLAPIQGRFHKYVAMNSYDTAPKGHTYENVLVRVATDQGIEGVGVMGYGRPDDAFRTALRSLIGTNPLDAYEFHEGRIVRRVSPVVSKYPHLDGPLFDLIGTIQNKPAWQLIGPAVRDRIEVYDGTLYFSDVWFADRGVRAVVEEAEEALKKGYNGVKLKIGRGSKWMERDAGLRRDIEVIKAVRAAVGPKCKLLADANDGYRNDMDRAWRLMTGAADARLYWIEELFPESPENYTELRARMEKAGMKTLVADGENFRQAVQFAPYLKPRRLMDVLQMDIRTGGFLGNLEMARMGEEAGALSVPHNWGSQVGLFMGLHLAKAVKAVPAAEDDRSTCDAIIAEGYRFQAGHYTVLDTPGLGIRINDAVYRKKYEAGAVEIG